MPTVQAEIVNNKSGVSAMHLLLSLTKKISAKYINQPQTMMARSTLKVSLKNFSLLSMNLIEAGHGPKLPNPAC